MPPIADAECRETFEYYLRRDIFRGENCEHEFPNVSLDSILLARTELERQPDRRQFNQPLQHFRAHRHLLALSRNPLWLNGSAGPVRADREVPR